jgi:hypothetical protein
MNDYSYPYIRASGMVHGSDPDYIATEILLAQLDDAPHDAWSYSGGVPTDLGPRVWRTMRDLHVRNPMLARRLEKQVLAIQS